MLEQLRHRLRALEKSAVAGEPGCLPLGIDSIDATLGGGLVRGALHEIAATSEAHIAAATGFALGPAAQKRARVCWIAEDMALAESGALYGGGLDLFGLAPERLLAVAASSHRDLLWAMEEALRCRAIDAVIGEWRHGTIDAVAVRRLSLAAAENGALALVLRAAPATDASTAATRWIVGAAPSAATAHGPGAPRFAAHLIRNRRGPLGSWILQWSNSDERFLLAPAQPLAVPVLDRPHRQNTQRVA
jgi:protein ImuA